MPGEANNAVSSEVGVTEESDVSECEGGEFKIHVIG